MEHPEIKFVRQFAKAWNNLDISHLNDLLAEDFTYESQWVFTPMKGRKTFLEYYNKKLQNFKNSIENGDAIVSAEIASHPSLAQNRPCIVLTHITKEKTDKVTLLVSVENEQITRIDVCFIPNPNTAILSGEIPR